MLLEMKPWWRKLRTLGLFVMILASVPLIYLTAEHIRGRRLLRGEMAEMRARHEFQTVADLAPKPLAPEENAAPDIIPLENALVEKSVFTDFNTCRISIGQGLCVPAWKLKYWYNSNLAREPWTDVEIRLVLKMEMLQRIRSALSKPGYDSGFNYARGHWGPSERDGQWSFHSPQNGMIMPCAQMLCISVNTALHKGDRDLAMRDLLLLVKLVSKQMREPLTLVQLERARVANLAMDTTWAALQMPGWTEAGLSALQSAWEGCDLQSDMARALEMEQALQLAQFDTFKQTPNALNRYLLFFENSTRGSADRLLHPSAQDWFLCHVYAPVWKFAWADLDEYLSLNHSQETIRLTHLVQTNFWTSVVNSPLLQESGSAYSSERTPSWFNQKRFLFAQPVMRANLYFAGMAAMTQTGCEMTRAAIALERFKLRENRLPSALEDLIPVYLPVVPVDRMDGKPLRYSLQSEGFYLLYSVGRNGTDEGGDSGSRQTGQVLGLDQFAPDLVWPITANDDEIQNSKVIHL